MNIREEKSYKERRKNNVALKEAIRYFERDLREEYIILRREAIKGESR